MYLKGRDGGKEGDTDGSTTAAEGKSVSASRACGRKRGRQAETGVVAEGCSPDNHSTSPVVRSARLSRSTETPREAAAATERAPARAGEQGRARRGVGSKAHNAPAAAQDLPADSQNIPVRMLSRSPLLMSLASLCVQMFARALCCGKCWSCHCELRPCHPLPLLGRKEDDHC